MTEAQIAQLHAICVTEVYRIADTSVVEVVEHSHGLLSPGVNARVNAAIRRLTTVKHSGRSIRAVIQPDLYRIADWLSKELLHTAKRGI